MTSSLTEATTLSVRAEAGIAASGAAETGAAGAGLAGAVSCAPAGAAISKAKLRPSAVPTLERAFNKSDRMPALLSSFSLGACRLGGGRVGFGAGID